MAQEVRTDLQHKLSAVVALIEQCTPRDYHWILRAARESRPWREKRRGTVNVCDQLLHVAYAAIILMPVLCWHSYLGAALAGFAVGTIREVEQYFKQDFRILMFWDRLQDVTFFVVGAVLVFALLG